jgi:hypothetical protein
MHLEMITIFHYLFKLYKNNLDTNLKNYIFINKIHLNNGWYI